MSRYSYKKLRNVNITKNGLILANAIITNNSPGNAENSGIPMFAIENKNQKMENTGKISDNPEILKVSL